MIAFIGLGAAGGNIADEASAKGILSIAINYSQKDLDSLEHVDARLKMAGSEGVGKNRDEAVRLMNRNWEKAIEFIKEHINFPSIEIVYVCFSAGGGSGGGMAPLFLELCMSEMPDKVFVAVPILPDKTEAMISQMNAIQTSGELSKLDICVLPLDNEKVKTYHPQAGKSELYKLANQTLVQLIDDMTRYTETESKSGILDRKDLKTILETKGIAMLTSTDIPDSENKVTNRIQRSWEHSIFAEQDWINVTRAGLIFDGPKERMQRIVPTDIFSKFEQGMPVELFEGYYHESKGKCMVLLAGMPWYRKRLKVMEDICKEKQSQLKGWEEEEYEPTITISRPIKPKQTTKQSAKDLLERYRR